MTQHLWHKIRNTDNIGQKKKLLENGPRFLVCKLLHVERERESSSVLKYKSVSHWWFNFIELRIESRITVWEWMAAVSLKRDGGKRKEPVCVEFIETSVWNWKDQSRQKYNRKQKRLKPNCKPIRVYIFNPIKTTTNLHCVLVFSSYRIKWEDNIKMDLQKVGSGGMDWIELARERDSWRALMTAAMNLRAPKKRGISWLAENRLACQEGLCSME